MAKKANKIWTPHPGSQEAFLSCPVHEALIEGSRGGGKTDVLLMDFLQHVGTGLGQEWRGILFREQFTQLTDVINKSKKWVSQIFPGAKYNGSEHKWQFPDGEQLFLRYMRVPSDYWSYHGHEYPWIGWEELTNWATNECFLSMMSCNRSSAKGTPLKIRASCNPAGVGHSWVKLRYIDPMPPMTVYTDPETSKKRVRIPSRLTENLTLLEADPNYINTIMASVQDDPVKYKAWVLGEWDIITGGAITDVWEPKSQVLPTARFPKSWNVYRSFDWGSSKPWSVGYGAEANGEQPDPEHGWPYIPAGSVILIDEIYGWNGTVNEGDRAVSQDIAERVLAKDDAIRDEFGCSVFPGPADTGIYEVRDGTSIATNLASHGCTWTRAYKGSGSRVSGLALIRQLLSASKRRSIEKPGLYFFDRARHHLRTFPLLQYDEKKPEDVDSDQEDHCFTGDTLVSTGNGLIPIKELVGTNGTVLSVNGEYLPYANCRKYFDKSKLVRVQFSDGYFVDCTPDHKFLTTEGLMQASLLTPHGTQCVVSKDLTIGKALWKKSLSFQKPNKNFVEWFITVVENISKKMELGYIGQYGNFTMDQFQTDTTFIIKMESNQVTNQIILNWFLGLNTLLYTKKGTNEECQTGVLKQLRNGITLLKVENGTNFITRKQKQPSTQKLNGNVPTVKNSIARTSKMLIHSVRTIVNLLLDEHLELTRLKESVLFVPNNSKHINSQEQLPAVAANASMNLRVEVLGIQSLEEEQETYCLTVDKTHVFALGNGVIVSNCYDDLRYLLTRKMTALKRRGVRY